MAAPVTIDYVSDWVARLRTRLYTEFRTKVSWIAWATMLGQQFQDLEDSGQSILTLLDIDNAEGIILDLIGRIVGQPRLGVGDATYRLYLKARISANRSVGDPASLYAVFTALLGAVGFVVTTSDIGVKEFKFRVKGAITRAQASAGAYFLGVAKEAGARAVLEWQESATALLFTFDSGPGFDVGLFAGAASAA